MTATALGEAVSWHYSPRSRDRAIVGWLARATAVLGLALAAPGLAVPPNTPITNTATATYTVGGEAYLLPASASIVTDALPQTGAAARFLGYAPTLPGALVPTVAASQCESSGGSLLLDFATVSAGVDVTLPDVVSLAPAELFKSGTAIFLEIADADANVYTDVADGVLVEVRAGSDLERVRLYETGTDTGVFVGHLPTLQISPPTRGNCVVEVGVGERLTLSYVDEDDPTDTAVAIALVDAPSMVFSSDTGMPVDGALVTLIDMDTGRPADAGVFGDDGVSAFPATVTAGGSAVDDSGRSYDFGSGGYRFPTIQPGNYRLEVTAPPGYGFPSTAPDSAIAALPTAPFALLPGSRGEPFSVAAGAVVALDVPLDLNAADLFLTKTASVATAGIGDFVQYQVRVENPSDAGVADVVVVDKPPFGFRYVSGSAQQDGVGTSDPSVDAEGRLSFSADSIESGAAAEYRYVLEITPGAALGQARNLATASGFGVADSNVAHVDITVREDLLQSRSTLTGRVYDGDCNSVQGLAGIRVWLEDGTYVVTDSEGRYHIEGVRPGSHVLMLDSATLPDSHEVTTCEVNTRFAGSSISQFVDIPAGALWRADFHVAPKPPEFTELRVRLVSAARKSDLQDRVSYRLEIAAGEVALESLTAVLQLPEAVRYLPGSLKVDSEVVADPANVETGAFSIPLADVEGAFSKSIRFDVDVLDPNGLLTAKAFVMARSEHDGKVRTPVATNELSLNWPSDLNAIARGAGDVAAGVFEPSRGRLSSRGPEVEVGLTAWQQTAAEVDSALPEIDHAAAPGYGRGWLAEQDVGNQLVWPQPGHVPRIPAITVAAKHKTGLRPQLVVNGALANPLTFEGAVTDARRGVALAQWGNVGIGPGDNEIEVRLLDVNDDEVAVMRTTAHFSGAPIRAELVEDASMLVADGLTPPIVAVRFYDRDGFPARPGMTGEFSVADPHSVLDRGKAIEAAGGKSIQSYERYLVRRDGIAFIQLEPTTTAGEVKLRFDFSEHRQVTVRARLLPRARDWIVVGLAEGTLGYEDFHRPGQDLPGDVYTEGRAAFYAKGQIMEDWLVTAAYDSDKDRERSLGRQIDPNRFYTLYGDGSEQRYDAASQRQLYLKVERDALSGLFGDFDTGLGDTEFTRYDRRLNGFKGEQFGKRWSAKLFASSTEQAYVRDELAGDGTSGTYRLSQGNLIANSEVISIVARDRFQLDRVVDRRTLVRYLDYSIDYDRGTLIFKQPVFSQDAEFNPIFIEAEYEVAAGEGENLLIGSRLAYRLDDQDSELAVTYINDGTLGQDGELLGLDMRWQFGPGTRLSAEAAQSRHGGGAEGAYLLELDHQSANLAGRAYLRQQAGEFGLGQQTGLDSGTRKLGVEGEYRWHDQLSFRSDIFRQEALVGSGSRTVMDSDAEYRLGTAQLTGGLRSVRETLATGDKADTQQLTAGISKGLLSNRLNLRADMEAPLHGSGSADYPARLLAGAEYEVTGGVRIFAEQELGWNDARDTQDTRFGIKARPWQGADLNGTVQREHGENGERVFATTGLVQQWRLNEHWTVDVGGDRVKTLTDNAVAEEPEAQLFNPILPPASGSFGADFTALFAGVGFRRDAWDIGSRLEFHGGETDKWNLLAGASHQQEDGRVTSASLSQLVEDSNDSERVQTDLRWGIALRPRGGMWTLLNRLDLGIERQRDSVFNVSSRKLVNNFNANRKYGASQLSLQLGAKLLRVDIDGESYDSLTGLYGVEYRHDLGQRWDAGARAAGLVSFGSKARRYSVGLSVGRTLASNAWLSVGYNLLGFEDRDFIAADYTARGPYLKLRIKFDRGLIDTFTRFVSPEAPQRPRKLGSE